MWCEATQNNAEHDGIAGFDSPQLHSDKIYALSRGYVNHDEGGKTPKTACKAATRENALRSDGEFGGDSPPSSEVSIAKDQVTGHELSTTLSEGVNRAGDNTAAASGSPVLDPLAIRR